MGWVAGADGCKSGWFRASRETETGALSFDAVRCASDLITRAPRPDVLAVDMLIGLTESGQRACDREARNLLGWPRRNSVFPAPIRAALGAHCREEASCITRNQDGRRVGCMAWGLYPKIREMDELLQSRDELRQIIREVHPEVCFQAWSGGRAMRSSKKTPAGKAERLALAVGWLGTGVLDKARGTCPRSKVGDDDILDAIGALWSAARIFAGIAEMLPASPESDSTGLRMEIVY